MTKLTSIVGGKDPMSFTDRQHRAAELAQELSGVADTWVLCPLPLPESQEFSVQVLTSSRNRLMQIIRDLVILRWRPALARLVELFKPDWEFVGESNRWQRRLLRRSVVRPAWACIELGTSSPRRLLQIAHLRYLAGEASR
jgi:hypothetical protein